MALLYNANAYKLDDKIVFADVGKLCLLGKFVTFDAEDNPIFKCETGVCVYKKFWGVVTYEYYLSIKDKYKCLRDKK